MQIYVAGPYVARDRVMELAAQLEAAGHALTYKWWAAEDDPFWTPDGGVAPDPRHEAIAQKDLQGAMRASAVVVLVPPAGGTGMWIEVGAALAIGIPVYLVPLDASATRPPWRSIFDLLCTRLSESELFAVLGRQIHHQTGAAR